MYGQVRVDYPIKNPPDNLDWCLLCLLQKENNGKPKIMVSLTFTDVVLSVLQISKSLIVGKAVAVIWPWSRRSWINSDQWPGSKRVKEAKADESMQVVI